MGTFLTVYIVVSCCGSILLPCIFLTLFDEKVLSSSLVAFRLTINLLAFLMANVFKQLFMYYVSGVAIALLLAVVGWSDCTAGGADDGSGHGWKRLAQFTHYWTGRFRLFGSLHYVAIISSYGCGKGEIVCLRCRASEKV